MMKAAVFIFRRREGGIVEVEGVRAVHKIGDRLAALVAYGSIDELLERLARLTELLGLAECMATYEGLAARPLTIDDIYLAAVEGQPGPNAAGVALRLTPRVIRAARRIRFRRVAGETLYVVEYVRPLSTEEMLEEDMLPVSLLECLEPRRPAGRRMRRGATT